MKVLIKLNKSLITGLILTSAILVSSTVSASLPGHDKREFTSEFDCPSGNFLNSGVNNKFFPLVVGDVKVYNNQACIDDGECDEFEEVTITVTDVIETVGAVDTRVVMEEEKVDGVLKEESFNYFAICQATGDVLYFGEAVDIYHYDDDGVFIEVTHDGAWRADDDDASPGIIMPGSFMLGARYFQEIHPEAMDRGENVAMGLNEDGEESGDGECVQVNDTNALEDPKGKEFDVKIYCPGAGLVKDEDLKLQE